MNRILAFLFGCMIVRFAWAFAAYRFSTDIVWWMTWPALVIGLGMWIIFLFDLRPTGAEVNHERIWWNHLRPLHGTLYLAFALLAFTRSVHAHKLLFADAILGFLAFTVFHVSGRSF